jgi:hypothetical protein
MTPELMVARNETTSRGIGWWGQQYMNEEDPGDWIHQLTPRVYWLEDRIGD